MKKGEDVQHESLYFQMEKDITISMCCYEDKMYIKSLKYLIEQQETVNELGRVV
jgi:hypothetical protein